MNESAIKSAASADILAKKFVGCKIIKATPMDKFEFLEHYQGVDTSNLDQPNLPGYLVIYPDDYHSWSPKEVFETCYREITNEEINLINS